MPIVNGVYVNDSLGDAKQAQEQVFGSYSKKDMNDYSTAAYNYLMKQQEQAYNLQMWQLMNEYNTPAAQMQRFQDAGLNPNLIYGQSNTTSAPPSASAASFRPNNLAQKQTSNALNMIGQFGSIIKQAKDIYDYATYGAPIRQQEYETSMWNKNLLIQKGQEAARENLWGDYMMGRLDPGTAEEIANSPRGKMQSISYDVKQSQIDRMEAYIKMIPDQQARLAALKALDDYRLQILKGQNDAVLNIHTGNDTADAFLKAFIYFGMSKI